MSGRKKSTTKARGKSAEAVNPVVPRALKKPTLVHIAYHPEVGQIGGTVQQDATALGQTTRASKTEVIAISDLSTTIRKALETAFQGIAAYLDAAPIEKQGD